MGSRKANFANNSVSLGLRPSQTWLIWDNGEKEMKDKQSGMPTICLSFFYPQTSILPSSPSSVRDPGKKKIVSSRVVREETKRLLLLGLSRTAEKIMVLAHLTNLKCF